MALLSIERGSDGALVLAGELDLSTVDLLEQATREAPGDERLILDLSGVTFLDSSGIRGLVRVSLAREAGTVVVRDPPPRVVRVLRLVGLDGDAAAWTVEQTRPSADGIEA